MEDWGPVEHIAASVNKGKQTATELVKKSFKLIDKFKDYQAIISVLKDNALKRAAEIDQLVSEGKTAGRLAGVPFIAKDNFLVFGADTTAASNILRGFRPPYQATAIERLEKEGAICVAKANLDAFAHGASTENSDFFVTKNPHDKTRVPGGSSGGSAAAVALGLAPFSLGTDTGGSIRQPSSFCGVVGYKPTYGLVSRSGVIAMGSSLDCIGVMARTTADAALVLDVMSGKDQLDATTIEKPGPLNSKPLPLTGLKIGLVSEYMGDGVNSEIRDKIKAIVELIKQQGAKVIEVNLPTLPLALACYYIICPAEVSSNLSRYDGQRYGYSDPDAKDLYQSYVNSRGKGFGREAKRRIMIGSFVLSSGYYDAYYKKAQTVRTKIINEFKDAFNQYDFLIGPVTPTTAFKIGENSSNPLDMYLADIMTVGANLAGIPAISLPAGSDSAKLPIGLQLMADQRRDAELLGFSQTLEGIIS
jgi:aspartyl-tRNA(Asn)/glutamyl-tRNA(Gln) amidotransferase subunit A